MLRAPPLDPTPVRASRSSAALSPTPSAGRRAAPGTRCRGTPGRGSPSPTPAPRPTRSRETASGSPPQARPPWPTGGAASRCSAARRPTRSAAPPPGPATTSPATPTTVSPSPTRARTATSSRATPSARTRPVVRSPTGRAAWPCGGAPSRTRSGARAPAPATSSPPTRPTVSWWWTPRQRATPSGPTPCRETPASGSISGVAARPVPA